MSRVILYFEKESGIYIFEINYELLNTIYEYTFTTSVDSIFRVFLAPAKYFAKYDPITFHSIISKLHPEFFGQTKYRIYSRLASVVTGSINYAARNLSKITILRATV